MFTVFRYGLLPVVLFCVVIVAASIDAFSTNAMRSSTWPQSVATVLESQDFGDAYAEFSGKKNTFPDPQGSVRYVVDGKTYTWRGRGRDIGVTAMKPGDKIKVFYNPENPHEISTLILLGAGTGSIILTAALAFLAFYFWFFWLRGFLRRSGPSDFDGDTADSSADPLPSAPTASVERPRSVFAESRPTQGFGKRQSP